MISYTSRKIMVTSHPLVRLRGYKITRCTIKEKLPQVFNIVEEYVSTVRSDKTKPADCENEQYCWFLRLTIKVVTTLTGTLIITSQVAKERLMCVTYTRAPVTPLT